MFIEIKDIQKFLAKKGYRIRDPWDIVDLFENKVAEYAGSKYAVALDSCTNALFLSLKFLKANGDVTIPKKTYLSVPSTIMHANCKPVFENLEWSGIYRLKPYPIIDGATRFTKDMYVKNTFHCLSFHRKKVLAIGKGGMILTNDKKAYNWFKLARYNGRNERVDHKNIRNLNFLGWNMYMPPEQAARGLKIFFKTNDYNIDTGGSHTYKDISKYKIFNEQI